ncbi:uncharacterized protein LOC128226221 [Mya arenaria]|uniref:uncharacterized protein LOC128226221 n=1 Tax=Mya arenaria TaxID=6604 RepID=UPI0022E8F174|nr:uncharacterized protein LOC128226221 [Mya arenaria]
MVLKVFLICLVTCAVGVLTAPGGNSAGSTVDLCSLPVHNTLPVTGTCNFNSDKCGYSFPPSLWHIHSENFGSLIYGKVSGDDHGQSQSFALFQSNDPKESNSTGDVVSGIHSPTITTQHACLSFWFLMPNQNSKLEVYLRTVADNSSRLIYSYKYQPASQWRQIRMQIDSNQQFQLDFMSVKENIYGYVGLDHVEVLIEKVKTTSPPPTTTTSPPPPTTTGPPPTTTTSPPPTTTTSPPTTTTTTTKTTSQSPPPTTTTSPSPPPPTTTLPSPHPTTTTTSPRTTTTSPTSPSTSLKTLATPTTPETTTAGQCDCKCPSVSTVCASDVISTTAAPIPTLCDRPAEQLSVHSRYSCSFDTDLCAFTLPIYPHLWEWTHFRYGNAASGEISGDSSSDGTGGYMVFNTDNNHVQNGTTHVLESPTLLAFTEYCLSFRFNLPTNVSSFHVFLNDVTNGSRTLVYSRSQLATAGWTLAKVFIQGSADFTVQFESRKTAEAGYLGLDDIKISILKPRVKRSEWQINNASPADDNVQGVRNADQADDTCSCTCPTVRVIDCDVTTAKMQFHSCSELTGAVLEKKMSCNFDVGTSCDFNIPMYPHLWELVRYRYGNESVGVVPGDASSYDGNGMYAAFTTNDFHVPIGEGGEMTSPMFRSTPGRFCLSFMYNMPTGAAKLSIYVISGGGRRLVWEEARHETVGWTEAAVVLDNKEAFEIAFYSEKSGLDSYFAVDDIRLYSNISVNA